MTKRVIWGCCAILALGTVLSVPSVARAHWSRLARYMQQLRKQQAASTAEPVSFQGVVQSATSKQIEVLVDRPSDRDNKDGKNKKAPHGKWSVLLPPDTPIHVKGEATPDYLHSGLVVQFTVPEENKETVATVHELTIVTAASRKHAHRTPAASKPTHGSSDSAASAAKSEGRTVVGQLGHFHDQKWPVLVEGKTWHVELADDVKINVAFAGSRFVGNGDKITVQGEMVHGKPGVCSATDVEVTLSKPLSASHEAKK